MFKGRYLVSSLGRVFSKRCGKIYELKGFKDKQGYLSVRIFKKSIKIHLIVAEAFFNHVSDGTHRLVVDHKDRNKKDNSVLNLQILTHRENVIKDKKSKFTGAVFHKGSGKYISRVYFNKKNYYLGYYNTKEEAHSKYLIKLNELNNKLVIK